MSRAAAPYFKSQNSGAYVHITSTAGLFGNLGQANYGAAKMALVGLMQTLSIEGAKSDIRVNCLAPTAATRMTEGLMPQAVLDAAPLGGLNLHPSLLPKHRGPAPVVGALLAGDTETAATIMLMDAGMDTGPILGSVETQLQPRENAGALLERLGQLGISLLLELLPQLASGFASFAAWERSLPQHSLRQLPQIIHIEPKRIRKTIGIVIILQLLPLVLANIFPDYIANPFDYCTSHIINILELCG